MLSYFKGDLFNNIASDVISILSQNIEQTFQTFFLIYL